MTKIILFGCSALLILSSVYALFSGEFQAAMEGAQMAMLLQISAQLTS